MSSVLLESPNAPRQRAAVHQARGHDVVTPESRGSRDSLAHHFHSRYRLARRSWHASAAGRKVSHALARVPFGDRIVVAGLALVALALLGTLSRDTAAEVVVVSLAERVSRLIHP